MLAWCFWPRTGPQEKFTGIHFQIIVSKRLPESENLWLGSLRNDLKAQSLDAIMNNRENLKKESNMDAYIDVLFRANKKTFTGANAMLADTLFEICEISGMTDRLVERMREKGLVESKEEGLEQGHHDEKLQIARNLLAEGSTPEFVQKITGLDMNAIKNIQAQ
jgi:hypothetical protein